MKIDVKLRYGFIIRAISQSYLSMVLSSALNVYKVSWDVKDMHVISNIIALTVAVVMVYIPINAFNILYTTNDLSDPVFKKRYKTFIVDLKTNSPLRFQFISVFFFRRALYAWVLVIVAFIPKTQIALLITIVAGMMVYLIIVMPYESILSTILGILNEALLLIMVSIWTRFTDNKVDRKTSSEYGRCLVYILIGTIIINWVAIITYGTTLLVKKGLKKKKLQKIKRKRSSTERVLNEKL